MNRIKDLNKVKTRPDMLYCEVIEKRLASGLFLPDDGKTGWDYLIILAKGSKVEDAEVGDIVLQADGAVQTTEIKGKKYGVIARHLCSVIVSPDNIEF
jgi:co-chaperonin GroES (HSP10)